MVLRRDAVLRCYGAMTLMLCYGVVLNGSPPMGTPRRAEATRRRRGCGTTLRLKISELLNRLPPIHQRIARAGYASYPLYPATTVTPPPTMRLKISELLNRLPLCTRELRGQATPLPPHERFA